MECAGSFLKAEEKSSVITRIAPWQKQRLMVHPANPIIISPDVMVLFWGYMFLADAGIQVPYQGPWFETCSSSRQFENKAGCQRNACAVVAIAVKNGK